MNVQTITPPPRQADDGPRILRLPDGRKLLLDRRAIAFLCEGKPEEFAGKIACPVTGGYQDLKSWWHGERNTARGAQP